MKTVDEMQAELEANGYKIELTDFHVRYESYLLTPDGFSFIPHENIEDPYGISENERKAIVEKGWFYYQREKERERLETALERIEAICQSRIEAWKLTSDKNVLAIIKAECKAALVTVQSEVKA